MLKRQRQQISENPFHGMKALRNLYEAGQQDNVTIAHLNKAWEEVKNGVIEDRQAFFSICFQFGEIPNRHHHIFDDAKVGGGGEGSRKSYELFMEWMLDVELYDYFYQFLNDDLFRQYTSVWTVLRSGIRTVKGSDKIIKVHTLLEKIDLDRLAEYLAKIIQTAPEAELVSLAKYLSRIRFTRKRKSGKYTPVQERNRKLLNRKQELYKKLSEIMGWPYYKTDKGNWVFKGLQEWKKKYNSITASRVFSSKKVTQWNKDSFTKWLDKIPAMSRQRVFAMVNKDDEKWVLKDGTSMKDAYKEWQEFKEQSQRKARVLKDEIETMTRTDMSIIDESIDHYEVDPELLAEYEEAKKEAKVTTGSMNLIQLFNDLFDRNKTEEEVNIIADSILDKMDLQIPVLVAMDDSGSMNSRHAKYQTTRKHIASIIATMLMLKNPSPELKNIIAAFGVDAVLYSDSVNQAVEKENKYMSGKRTYVEGLIDRTENFTTNFKRLFQIVKGIGHATNVESVADTMLKWINEVTGSEREVRIDIICNYPVILFVSDNQFNSGHTSLSSIQSAMSKLRSIGWDGIFVLWDVEETSAHGGSKRFEGMENLVYLNGTNASTLTQILRKLHDSEIVDMYSAINSTYKDERYEPVRTSVVKAELALPEKELV